MWSWYKEWSEIARMVIPSKAKRIELGISQASRRRAAKAPPPAAEG